MKRKLLLALTAVVCAICCAFGLVACNDKDGATPIAIESIALSQTSLTLDVDGYETLSVTYTPSNATAKRVTWSSSAPTVASVDSTGKVTAKAAGTATITARTANDKTATCLVTVNPSAPVTEVNSAQWTQILNGANNYTYTQTFPDMSIEHKVVDNKWQQTDNSGDVNQIIVKDGETYYVYAEASGSWSRSTVTAAEAAQSPMAASYNIALGIVKVFKDDFSLFTYSDGKYTAASIDKTSAMGGAVTNVEVAFENGNLVKATFDLDDVQYEIKSVGTTDVDVPTVFTEKSPLH
ncbi:MAG: Ig-like domain-containing protein [Bacteroides sp.]|nr:Ig-like domain-containing protein [Bacillota bacterium]MCM1393653.1 Ig-like domain-containing protein [[Eubacterium] siraeum]MCM1455605.1 Ig-like domain-containing protein [Bacteroides sp.]